MRLQLPQELPFLFPDDPAWFGHQYAGVDARDRLADGFDHEIPQTGAGPVGARGVQKNKLEGVPGIHPHDAGAGGLGLVGHDGDLAADDGVEKGRFAHIGPSHNGDKGGCGVHSVLRFCVMKGRCQEGRRPFPAR